jgi:hypothetical protein
VSGKNYCPESRPWPFQSNPNSLLSTCFPTGKRSLNDWLVTPCGFRASHQILTNIFMFLESVHEQIEHLLVNTCSRYTLKDKK